MCSLTDSKGASLPKFISKVKRKLEPAPFHTILCVVHRRHAELLAKKSRFSFTLKLNMVQNVGTLIFAMHPIMLIWQTENSLV